MRIIASDILADLSGLSLGLILVLMPIGLVLWLFGWRSHRFWIVLTATIMAGIIGLNQAPTWRAQPIVVAVLLAIAAGVLALALVRVVAFLAGGIAGLSLLQAIYPSLHQPAIVFLVSGLVGLLVFRWCFMALTSLLGGALQAYGVLALLQYYETLDAVRWSDDNVLMLNSICGLIAFVGFLFQYVLDRRQNRRSAQENDEDDDEDENERPGVVRVILGMFGRGRSSGREAA